MSRTCECHFIDLNDYNLLQGILRCHNLYTEKNFEHEVSTLFLKHLHNYLSSIFALVFGHLQKQKCEYIQVLGLLNALAFISVFQMLQQASLHSFTVIVR